MTLTQLSYIVAVDTYRHFATAAEKSFVTQPTLSMQIQKLEDELNVIVFDRSKQPVIPTETGKKIIEQARIILKESQQIKHIVNENNNAMEGTYRVGIIPTISSYLIPLFLKQFAEKYPHINLIFQELITADILNKLTDDTIDVGIIATNAPAQYKEKPLYFEPFCAYIADNHPLLKTNDLIITDIEPNDLWLLSEGHCLRDQTLDICKAVKKQSTKTIHFESGNLETLVKLVNQGYGITLLPWLATTYIDDAHKHQIKCFVNPPPGRTVRLIYSRLYSKNKLLQALEQEILAYLPDTLNKQTEK